MEHLRVFINKSIKLSRTNYKMSLKCLTNKIHQGNISALTRVKFVADEFINEPRLHGAQNKQTNRRQVITACPYN